MKILRLIGICVALLVVAATAVFFFAPGRVVALTQWQAASAAGLSSKSVTVDGYEVNYFEGGDGPILIMLHGMADDRHSFVGTAGHFTTEYRVILPDLKGHGDNAPDPELDYSIAGQVGFVQRFVEALALQRFDLVGNSMGGHTSAAYALAYPGKVEHLVLVNAPGLVADDTVVYGGFGAALETEAQFDALMARVLHNPPAVPGPIKRHLMETANARVDFINGLAKAVREGPLHDLSDRIETMSVPTLVVWGEEDVVVPFAVGEAYAARIADAELKVLPEAGHSPQLEAPERVADAIKTFLTAP